MKCHRLAIFLAALLCMSLCTALALAEPSDEYKVKAAFLYNFAMFTQWPPEVFAAGDSPLIVGVIGINPFDHALEKSLAGKSIRGHPLRIKYLDSNAQIPDCMLLFVPASEDVHLSDIFSAVGRRPILTVGETDNFSSSGGIIRFYIETDEEDKVHFEIDIDAAKKAQLRISSQLMQVAKVVKRSN